MAVPCPDVVRFSGRISDTARALPSGSLAPMVQRSGASGCARRRRLNALRPLAAGCQREAEGRRVGRKKAHGDSSPSVRPTTRPVRRSPHPEAQRPRTEMPFRAVRAIGIARLHEQTLRAVRAIRIAPSRAKDSGQFARSALPARTASGSGPALDQHCPLARPRPRPRPRESGMGRGARVAPVGVVRYMHRLSSTTTGPEGPRNDQ
jgi:hypothetical protein